MKRFLIIVSLLTAMAIVLYGCGGSKPAASDKGNTDKKVSEDVKGAGDEGLGEDAEESKTETDDESKSGESTVKASGEFENITKLSEYWSDLYATNETAVNGYVGLETLAILTPGLSLAIGCQYDILNLYNEDGHFEGNLLLAGYSAFADKKGSEITFGYDEAMEEDTFSAKKGDRLVENGNCNLDKGYYFTDSHTDRGGDIIIRSTTEFMKYSDGSMSSMVIEGRNLNYYDEEELSTSYTFMWMSDGKLEYAVANTETGTDFDVIHLEEGMTKEKAMELFEAAGATIAHSGGNKDGKFSLD